MGKLAHKTTIFFFFHVNTLQRCLRTSGVLGLNNLVKCVFFKFSNIITYVINLTKIYRNKLKRTCYNKLYQEAY